MSTQKMFPSNKMLHMIYINCGGLVMIAMLKNALVKSVMDIEDFKTKQLMATNVCNGYYRFHMCILIIILLSIPMLD